MTAPTWLDGNRITHMVSCAGSVSGDCRGCDPAANGHPHDPADPDRPDLLAGLRNGAWLDAQQFPPLTYAVPGLIPEGLTLLIGPPKVGKSWLVLGAALAVAAGGVAVGVLRVAARPVLYLALEDGDRRLQDRCRALLEGDPIPAGLDYLTRIPHGLVLDTIAAWLARHHGAAPLVVLDTLGRVMPPALQGESSYQRDYRIGAALKRLADEHPGAALLVNHHDRKAAAEDFVDSVSGTHGLAGAADTITVLSRRRHESDGLVKVTGRDVEEGEYAVAFTAGGAWQLAGADLAEAAAAAEQNRATAGVGDRSSEVIEYVGEHPDGVRTAEVALALGLDKDTAGAYLRRAHDAGRVHRPARGLYTPVRSVRSFGSGSDTADDQQRRLGEPGSETEHRTDAVFGPDWQTEHRTEQIIDGSAHVQSRDQDRQPEPNRPNTPNATPRGGVCTACGEPLNPRMAQAGETTHPGCTEEDV